MLHFLCNVNKEWACEIGLLWPGKYWHGSTGILKLLNQTFKKNSVEKTFFLSSLFCEIAKTETVLNTCKNQKSENTCNNHTELTQNSCTLPFMFDL